MYKLSLWLMGLLMMSSLSAQHLVEGTVFNEVDQPLPGAIVKVKDSYHVTGTDVNGQFKLKISQEGDYTLIVSFIGYQTQELQVKVPAESSVGVRMARNEIVTQEAVVSATRASELTPMANSELTEEDIAKLNNGQDLPYLIRFTPSLVVTSDAGAGVGYTGLRIRGSDASRINVNINGIPLNDPESQGVFWVNIPDFASSVNSLQVQRGVGTSVNGAGAFGGSINMSTLGLKPEAYGGISNSIGSYNTFRHNVEFGTGLIDEHWVIEGRLSQITSDGYIDRASSELRSYYLSGAYYGENTTIKAITFAGKEVTYQSWYGTPESRLNNDQEAMLTHAANEGYDEEQLENLLNSGRTYNYYLYENEVDNYAQDHYQLHISQKIGKYLEFNVAGHYTWGRGYFEQYRKDDDLEDYGLNPIDVQSELIWSNAEDSEGNPVNTNWGQEIDLENVSISQTVQTNQNGDPITDDDGNTLLAASAQVTATDLVRRRWLDNDFYGMTFSLDYRKKNLAAVLGGAVNRYDGDHFGEIIWARTAASTEPGYIFYLNNGLKDDANIYLKADYKVGMKWSFYGDVQVREVKYRTEGIDIDRRDITLEDELFFINPKAGFNYQLNASNRIYGSYSIGNREPTRNDYIDAPEGVTPKAETMGDLELGYERRSTKYYWGLNLYSMDYTDQLVLTGELNDVGSPIRTNVASSYRRGAEFEFGWNLRKNVQLYANFTYSQNKIENYDYTLYNYLSSGDVDVQIENFEDTDISFSPEIISAAMLSWKPVVTDHHDLELAWMTQYVGEQYLDNTSNPDRLMEAYLVNDLRVTYILKNKLFKEVRFNLLVNNVLDEEYVSNGYTYSYGYEGFITTENFYYPQAPRNFLLGLDLKF